MNKVIYEVRGKHGSVLFESREDAMKHRFALIHAESEVKGLSGVYGPHDCTVLARVLLTSHPDTSIEEVSVAS